MKEPQICIVAKVLSKNSIAVKDWKLIKDSLEIPDGDDGIFKAQHLTGTKTSYELFHIILKTWKTCKGARVATSSRLIKTITDLGYLGLAEEIENELKRTGGKDEVAEVTEKLGAISLEKPKPTKAKRSKYEPRPKFEKSVLEMLLKTGERVNDPFCFPLVTICGGKGYGKTMLAKEIQKQCEKKKYFDGETVWINAATESDILESFEDEYIDLLAQGSNKKQRERIQKKLAKDELLIIFDDVRDYKLVEGFLPTFQHGDNPKIGVLMTAEKNWEKCTSAVEIKTKYKPKKV